MDKKFYFEPEIEVIDLLMEASLLADSGDVDENGGDAPMNDNPATDPDIF